MQNKNTKYIGAVALYESGLSIQECADFNEISRQAMHAILNRRGCKFRPNLRFGSDNHFHRKCAADRSKKERAHDIVEGALRKGLLQRAVSCEECGVNYVFSDGRSGIQAHHFDYDKPLEVLWLCQKCHHLWHKNNTPLNEVDQRTEGAIQ